MFQATVKDENFAYDLLNRLAKSFLRAEDNNAQVCQDTGDTVKHFLRDHCYERPPVLKNHIFLAEGPTFQCD